MGEGAAGYRRRRWAAGRCDCLSFRMGGSALFDETGRHRRRPGLVGSPVPFSPDYLASPVFDPTAGRAEHPDRQPRLAHLVGCAPLITRDEACRLARPALRAEKHHDSVPDATLPAHPRYTRVLYLRLIEASPGSQRRGEAARQKHSKQYHGDQRDHELG